MQPIKPPWGYSSRGSAATCPIDVEKPSWRAMLAAMKQSRHLSDCHIEVLGEFEKMAEEKEALLVDELEAKVQIVHELNACELERRHKPSVKVRELRASEKALATQQRYIEAEQMKSEVDLMEDAEFARKAALFSEGVGSRRAFVMQQDHRRIWKAVQRDLCDDFERLVYEGSLPDLACH